MALRSPDGLPLRFIGRGDEHFVYQVHAHPKSVVKLSIRKCREILSAFDGGAHPRRDQQASYAERRFRPDVVAKNEQIRELRRFFGAHALAERRYVVELLLPKDLVIKLYEEDPLHRRTPAWLGPLEPVWTHVAVQRYYPAACDPERLSLSFGRFTEDAPHERDVYRALHRTLSSRRNTALDRDLFLSVQDQSECGRLGTFVRAVDADPKLRAAARSFVSAAIRYAERTRNILALAGEDNVIFHKAGPAWTYCLIDAVPIPAGRILAMADAVAAGARPGRTLSKGDRETVKRALNFIRLIDGLAMCVGIPERYGLSHRMAALADLDLGSDGAYGP